MPRLFRESDANRTWLFERNIAVVGYGNQGRSQALNLRDSGANVVIGNIDDEYRTTARSDGFDVYSIAEAVGRSDVIVVLLPDELAPRVFEQQIQPHLKPADVIVFASGYNVHFGSIVCPPFVDVALMAPRMVGTGVRALYLSGEGFYSFVGVHQDASGKAWDVLLALCSGIGTLRKGALEVSFAVETELDLFNEQAFGPAFGRVLLTAIQTLIDAGYPKEAVLLEFYMSGEFGHICKEMSETGLIRQLDQHSQTSQYGAISRGIRFLGLNLARPMRRILKEIRTGKFAREWRWEQWTGKLRYRFLRRMALRQPINAMEQSVRQTLGLTTR